MLSNPHKISQLQLALFIIIIINACPGFAGSLTSTSYYVKAPVLSAGSQATTSSTRSLQIMLGLAVNGRLLTSSSYIAGGGPLTLFNRFPTVTPSNYNDDRSYLVDEPKFTWTYADKDNHAQRKFRFELYSGVFDSLLLSSGEVSSSSAYYQTRMPGMVNPLTTYTWRISVSDGYEWSEWANAGTGFKISDVDDQEGDAIPWIRAKTDFFGSEIPEATWQFDDSPYFYWQRPDSISPIQGYSIELNALPDDEVDTLEPNIQYADDALSEGENIFYARSLDESGNWGEMAAFEIWLDKTPPEIAIGSPDNGTTIENRLPQIWATVSDEASGIDSATVLMYLDGQRVNFSYSPSTGKVLYLVPPGEALANGPHTVWVSTSDNIGLNAEPEEWTFEVAAGGFIASIVLNDGADTTDTTLCSLYIYADNDTGPPVTDMRIRDDTSDTGWISYAEGRRSWQLSLDPGQKTVYVSFKLVDGTVMPEVLSDDIWLVTLYPDTIITAGPSGVTDEGDATFKFESTKPGSSFSYKLNGFDWSEWTPEAEITITDIGTGNHYFQVRSKDSMDNIDQTPAIRTWTIGPSELAPVPEKPIKYWKELGEEE